MARRATNTERTRRGIEEALTRLLGTKPYASITVADIAAEADVAERTVHRHYGGKDGILVAEAARFGTALLEAIRRRPAPTDAAEDLRNFVSARFEMHERYRARSWAILSRISDVPALREVIGQRQQATRHLVEALVTRWPDAWLVEPARAVQTISALASYYSWRAYTEVAGVPTAAAEAEVADLLCTTLLR